MPFDAQHGVFHDDDLQRFLLNKQVKTIRPEFFQQDGRTYWAIYLEYDVVLKEGCFKTDGLNEPQNLLFQRLREWRRITAEKAGLPVFIIATNRQLLDLIKYTPKTVEGLRQIRGFGKKKTDRYGQELLDLLRAFYEQTPQPEKKSL